MKYYKLAEAEKTLLGIDDIANTLVISRESAKVTASRYAAAGFLVRLKRDLYIPAEKLMRLKEEELFHIANIVQVPSYISLTTALSYYNVSAQQQQNFIESIQLKRTKTVKAKNIEFAYTKIKKEMYTGFDLLNDFFIALPEKAIADAVYLTAIGKYNCDFDAVDFKKIKKSRVEQFINLTNRRTKTFWGQLCKTYRV
ncbi:MAG: hypothetical protein FJ213_12535 [Ignavibacteria bacterium]|nr:hypothetical protein [Ignavibacteria bacterium]